MGRRGSLRALWEGRKADRITASTTVFRTLLINDPTVLPPLVDSMRAAVTSEKTPLRWRLADLKWCWLNAMRAASGLPPVPVPHEEGVKVEVGSSHRDFESGTVTITLTRRRIYHHQRMSR